MMGKGRRIRNVLGMGCPGTEMFMISIVECPIVGIVFAVDLLDIRWSIRER